MVQVPELSIARMAFPFLSPTTAKGETMQDLLRERARQAELIKIHAMSAPNAHKVPKARSIRSRCGENNLHHLDEPPLVPVISNFSDLGGNSSNDGVSVPHQPDSAWPFVEQVEDLDDERYTKTLQLVSTTRNLTTQAQGKQSPSSLPTLSLFLNASIKMCHTWLVIICYHVNTIR